MKEESLGGGMCFEVTSVCKHQESWPEGAEAIYGPHFVFCTFRLGFLQVGFCPLQEWF